MFCDFISTAKRIIASTLAVSLVLSCFAFAFAPQPAQAQMTVFDPKNFIQNAGTFAETKFSAVMNSISASALKSLGLKEWALDGVLFALAKKALQQMTRSTIAWINSGFKGSPMYIQNPEQFFTNIGDEIAGDIIYGSSLSGLCSPINIRVALNFYYQTSQQRQAPQCTLSGVVRNVDQFMQGNFLAGGWPGWLSVAITPTNQPIGGVIAAVGMLESSLKTGLEGKAMRLNWGQGFLSYEECTENAGPPGPGGASAGKTCNIITPGSTIASALSFELSTGARTLIEADEINEIIGALFAQLGNQALTSLRGVNGLSKPAPAGTGGTLSPNVPSGCAALSYLDQLNSPGCNPNIGYVGGTSTIQVSPQATESFVSEALASERAYQDLYEGVRNDAADVMNDASDEGLSCRSNERVFEDAREIRDDAAEKIADADTLIADLLDIANRYEFGSGDAQVAAITEYLALEGGGTLHSEIDNAIEARRVEELEAEFETLRGRLETCRMAEDDEPED